MLKHLVLQIGGENGQEQQDTKCVTTYVFLKKKGQNGKNVIFRALESLNFVPKFLWTDFDIFIRQTDGQTNIGKTQRRSVGPKRGQNSLNKNFPGTFAT